MPLKVSESGETSLSMLAQATVYATDHGARIINMSWGPLWGERLISDAAKYAQSKGVIVTVSAGNYYFRHLAIDDPSILFVSATDQNDIIANFSDTGPGIDISAPGVGILTTHFGGRYENMEGTSFSAPSVAGVIALLLSVKPTLTPLQITAIIEQSADDLGPAGWDYQYGFGRINALKAIQMAIKGSYTIKKDLIAPSIPSLTANAIPGSSVIRLLWLDATDNTGIGGYNVYRNGSLWYTIYRTQFNEIVYSGSYDYQVSAFDRYGNESVLSNKVRLSVSDVIPPTVYFEKLISGSSVFGKEVFVDLCAEDNSNIYDVHGRDSIVFYVDGNISDSVIVAESRSYDDYGRTTVCLTYVWDTTNLRNGLHSLIGRSVDINGNTGSSAPVSVSISNLQVTSPNGGENWLLGTKKTLTWSDPTGLPPEYNIFLVTPSGQSVGIIATNYTGISRNWVVGSHSLGTVSPGRYLIKVCVIYSDEYCNTSKSRFNITTVLPPIRKAPAQWVE